MSNLIGMKFKFSQGVPFISDFSGNPLNLEEVHFEKIYTISTVEYPHIRVMFSKKIVGPLTEYNKQEFYIRVKEFQNTSFDKLISTIYIDLIEDIRDNKIDEILN